ncbi:hypothetical protein ACYZX9_12400 [Sphingomonas citri]
MSSRVPSGIAHTVSRATSLVRPGSSVGATAATIERPTPLAAGSRATLPAISRPRASNSARNCSRWMSRLSRSRSSSGRSSAGVSAKKVQSSASPCSIARR